MAANALYDKSLEKKLNKALTLGGKDISMSDTRFSFRELCISGKKWPKSLILNVLNWCRDEF